jgi:RNA polymerase sigma-70 factor (ECF subfamily)
MLHIAYSVLQNQADAEDAVQNAFISIAMNMDKIDEAISDKTEAYIYIITKNKARDLIRAAKRRIQYDDIDDHYDLSDDSFMQELTSQSQYSNILDCIYRMDDIYREMLILHYINNMSAKEISRTLNIALNTVRSRISRGKQMLKEILEREMV